MRLNDKIGDSAPGRLTKRDADDEGELACTRHILNYFSQV
jgi:hypothetical protein